MTRISLLEGLRGNTNFVLIHIIEKTFYKISIVVIFD